MEDLSLNCERLLGQEVDNIYHVSTRLETSHCSHLATPIKRSTEKLIFQLGPCNYISEYMVSAECFFLGF